MAAGRVVGLDVVIGVFGLVDTIAVNSIAATGVDFISVGALTHSAPAVDFSLELTEA